jgi:hypothetical protein
MAAKKRYNADPDFYRKKLLKVMEELGMKQAHWELKYDRWEGVRLDFTYKGVSRFLERIIDKTTIFYASDCLAQVVLTMEKFLWMKREGIFDLDVAAAGLPLLMEAIPQCFKELGFAQIPANYTEANERFRTLSREKHKDNGGSDEAMMKLIKARDDAKQYFEGK